MCLSVPRCEQVWASRLCPLLQCLQEPPLDPELCVETCLRGPVANGPTAIVPGLCGHIQVGQHSKEATLLNNGAGGFLQKGKQKGDGGRGDGGCGLVHSSYCPLSHGDCFPIKVTHKLPHCRGHGEPCEGDEGPSLTLELFCCCGRTVGTQWMHVHLTT